MNKEEFKLSDKELHKAIDNLKGTQFLDTFCILDWIIKTRDENKELQAKVNQLEQDKISILLDSNSLINANVKLQVKVNQLETNIKEAIGLINKDRNKEYGSLEKKSFYCSKTNKLLEILERGKEC